MTTRVPGGGIGKNPFAQPTLSGQQESQSVGEQVQDSLFNRPKPQRLEVDDALIDRLLNRLHVYRKKIARLAGDKEQDYDLTLAVGTIASIDQSGLVYVGRDFLLTTQESLDTQVGVIAHEIGHRPKRWHQYRTSKPLTRLELEDLCRLEETRADYFAGYALARLGLESEPVCSFLNAIQVHPHPEYFPASLREKTIQDGFLVGRRRELNLKKFFPEFAKANSPQNDLGEA